MSQTAAFKLSDVDPGEAKMSGLSAIGVPPVGSEMVYGVDGAGADFKIFGDTSGVYFMWDQSLDSLLIPGTAGKFQIGGFTGAAIGTGSIVSASVTAPFKIFADDGGAAIGSGSLVRAGWFRNLQTYTSGNREQESTGVQGSLVSVAGTNRHNMSGVLGSYEARTSLTVDGQAAATDTWCQAGVLGRVGSAASIITINSNGVLAGVAAMSNVNTGFAANSGVYTAFYAGAWASAVDWAYGMYLEGGKFTTGIDIGACTTGINFSGAFTTSGINISDVTGMEGDAEAGIMIGSWGTPLDSIATMTDNIRLYQGSLQVVDGPASGYKEATIFSGEIQTDGSNDLDYVDFSVIHTKTTIDKKLGWCYGAQHDVFKSGNDSIDDCHAVTAYLTTTGGPTFNAGRFAPLCALLSASGGNPTITGDVFGIWCAIRGQAAADSALQIHVQSAATATHGIKIDQNGTMTNAMTIYGAVTNFLDLDDASGFVTSGGTDCTDSAATDPGYTIKCIMPDGGAGYIRVWDAA